ncbi:MAG TPA: redoxin domain-containing protein [Gaiellaceae bacterium]|nr:redoxin domain-containing protein [Gaiellaceae bacterium]
MELLRDRSEEFRAAGVQPYAISRDSAYTHVAWTQALDLTFPLLSDWNGDATRGFGVATEHNGMRDVSRRTAFLLDRDGVVRGAWAYENAELPDLDELLDAAAALVQPGSSR